MRASFQDQELGKDLLPGFIVGKYMNRYHILGMNTSTILPIKNPEEENNGENNNGENNKENIENENKEDKKEEEKNKSKENNGNR